MRYNLAPFPLLLMRTELRFLPLIALLLLPACGKDDETKDPKAGTGVTIEENLGIQVITQPMPVNGKVELPGHGKEEWFAYGAMAGTEWTPANGVVTGHVFTDDTTVVAMQFNVQPAIEGTYYEAWIQSPKTGASLSMGQLINGQGDSRHGLRFESPEDLRAYTDVRVTLETDDGNADASTMIIATGELKPTKRR
ncbi:MAG: hypothetical protein Greene101449_392 [Candidatus Peregrinibacteria bacterium Greene1014_49]|nr:MAG: hypothetical protein Greene101449_392 [Candidatus Peregrinibacteria bacterium Greene1014_49]